MDNIISQDGRFNLNRNMFKKRWRGRRETRFFSLNIIEIHFGTEMRKDYVG